MFLQSILFKIVFYISIAFFGIFFLPCLVSKNATRKVVSLWAKVVIYLLQKLVGIKIDYSNDFIKKNQGYLIAANHQSIFETIFFLKEFDKVVYVIKKELKYIPLYGWYAVRLGNIFLDRKKRIESMRILSREVGKLIKNKYKVIIFPEGTRQDRYTIGNIKTGVFALQKELSNKVYPIYINSGHAWSRTGKISNKNNINIKVLHPIQIDLKKEDFLNSLRKAFVKENEKNKIYVSEKYI